MNAVNQAVMVSVGVMLVTNAKGIMMKTMMWGKHILLKVIIMKIFNVKINGKEIQNPIARFFLGLLGLIVALILVAFVFVIFLLIIMVVIGISFVTVFSVFGLIASIPIFIIIIIIAWILVGIVLLFRRRNKGQFIWLKK